MNVIDDKKLMEIEIAFSRKQINKKQKKEWIEREMRLQEMKLQEKSSKEANKVIAPQGRLSIAENLTSIPSNPPVLTQTLSKFVNEGEEFIKNHPNYSPPAPRNESSERVYFSTSTEHRNSLRGLEVQMDEISNLFLDKVKEVEKLEEKLMGLNKIFVENGERLTKIQGVWNVHEDNYVTFLSKQESRIDEAEKRFGNFCKSNEYEILHPDLAEELEKEREKWINEIGEVDVDKVGARFDTQSSIHLQQWKEAAEKLENEMKKSWYDTFLASLISLWKILSVFIVDFMGLFKTVAVNKSETFFGAHRRASSNSTPRSGIRKSLNRPLSLELDKNMIANINSPLRKANETVSSGESSRRSSKLGKISITTSFEGEKLNPGHRKTKSSSNSFTLDDDTITSLSATALSSPRSMSMYGKLNAERTPKKGSTLSFSSDDSITPFPPALSPRSMSMYDNQNEEKRPFKTFENRPGLTNSKSVST